MADEKSSERRASTRGGWWFLGAMLLLYLVVGGLDPALFEASLAGFVSTLTDLLPLFWVMFLLLWLFNLYVRPGQVMKQFGRAGGMRGWIFSIGAGVLSMGSMYLWYPVLGQLRSEGLRPGLAAAFLIAAPSRFRCCRSWPITLVHPIRRFSSFAFFCSRSWTAQRWNAWKGNSGHSLNGA